MEETTATATKSEPLGGVICPQCNKPFQNENALRMHKVRVHTPAGQYGYKWRQRRSKHELLAERREKARQVRADFYARGLDAHGKPYKPGRGPAGRGVHGPRKNPRVYGKSEEQKRRERIEYNRKWREAKRLGKRVERSTKRMEPIVYHREIPDALPQVSETQPNRSIRHCPYCGEKIERHLV